MFGIPNSSQPKTARRKLRHFDARFTTSQRDRLLDVGDGIVQTDAHQISGGSVSVTDDLALGIGDSCARIRSAAVQS